MCFEMGKKKGGGGGGKAKRGVSLPASCQLSDCTWATCEVITIAIHLAAFAYACTVAHTLFELDDDQAFNELPCM